MRELENLNTYNTLKLLRLRKASGCNLVSSRFPFKINLAIWDPWNASLSISLITLKLRILVNKKIENQTKWLKTILRACKDDSIFLRLIFTFLICLSSLFWIKEILLWFPWYFQITFNKKFYSNRPIVPFGAATILIHLLLEQPAAMRSFTFPFLLRILVNPWEQYGRKFITLHELTF